MLVAEVVVIILPLELPLVVMVVVVMVDLELVADHRRPVQPTLVAEEVAMEELDMLVVAVLLLFAIQVAKLDQAEQLQVQADSLITHSLAAEHSQVKERLWHITQD